MSTEKEITPEELSISNMYQLEALCRILVKKGILTMPEFTEELLQIKKESDQKIS